MVVNMRPRALKGKWCRTARGLHCESGPADGKIERSLVLSPSGLRESFAFDFSWRGPALRVSARRTAHAGDGAPGA
ncbi:MAG: hypothetical protein WCT14_11340 [Treponemataceae bacterium]